MENYESSKILDITMGNYGIGKILDITMGIENT